MKKLAEKIIKILGINRKVFFDIIKKNREESKTDKKYYSTMHEFLYETRSYALWR